MALRVRPNADTQANRKRLTRRLAITHELALVKSNGLPEPDYNQSLDHFDHDIHELVEDAQSGLVVIVETFAGKRIYYCYVDPTATIQARYKVLRGKYPEHTLEIEFHEEPDWATYELYYKLFPW